MATYDEWASREPPPEPTGDDERDHENLAEYYEYQLQCAFEDLCAATSYAHASKVTKCVMHDHGEMLRRQGRL